MDLLIFDLDGTLIDSKLDLAHSVNATRLKMGLPPLDHEVISTYVGNGAPVLIRRAIGPDADDGQLAEALKYFLDYYGEHKLDHTRLYNGTAEALDALQKAGVKMAVLTNKPVRISKAILDGLGVTPYFLQVYGGNSFEQKKPDPIGVHTLLSETGVEKSGAMMVGDSAVDIQTARNAGIAACGVTYGFQPEGFRLSPPDVLVDQPGELVEWVLNARAGRITADRP